MTNKEQKFNPFEQGSINFGLDLNLSTPPQESVIEQLPLQENISDSNSFAPTNNFDLSLDEMNFDGVEETPEENTFNPKDMITNIDISNLEIEASNFLRDNILNLVNVLASKDQIVDYKLETEHLVSKDYKAMEWNNDEEMLQALFHFVAYTEILERAKAMQEYYRAVAIDIYNRLDSSEKTVDLSIVTITESTVKAKDELAITPGKIMSKLEDKELKDKFIQILPSLDWSKMTKAGLEKLIELIKAKDKALYEDLAKNGFVKAKPGGTSYKVSSKL